MNAGWRHHLVNVVYYACCVSTTRMMILGLVRWLQPVHGYDVRRELLSWGVDEWANVQPGSIYHALRKLTEEGLLEEVATEQVGARPARTTYRVTLKGEREFEELLRKYWWEYKGPLDPFNAAFSFLPALPRREAVTALRNRAMVLDALVRTIEAGVESETWMKDKPIHVAWLFELGIDRGRLEADWCRRVADRIEQGEGLHTGEYDEGEAGRLWREAIERERGADAEPTAPS
jgi:DNA-binding PadR family transcriptional regulator